MIVYNITTKVDWSVADLWLTWQLEDHAPDVMDTGLFDDFKIFRLLEQDDSEGPTFVIQYFTSSKKRYQKFMDDFEIILRHKAFEKWNGQFVTYSTSMELVN